MTRASTRARPTSSTARASEPRPPTPLLQRRRRDRLLPRAHASLSPAEPHAPPSHRGGAPGSTPPKRAPPCRSLRLVRCLRHVAFLLAARSRPRATAESSRRAAPSRGPRVGPPADPGHHSLPWTTRSQPGPNPSCVRISYRLSQVPIVPRWELGLGSTGCPHVPTPTRETPDVSAESPVPCAGASPAGPEHGMTS